MIFIVLGLPGSGKSFFAFHLAKEVNAEYISSDILRKKMFAKRTYTVEEKQAVYNEMLSQMISAIKQKKNVVLDATFYKNYIRKKFAEAAKKIDDVIFVEVQAAEWVIRERTQKKREDSEADFEVYKKLKAEWEPMEEEHLVLQSTNDNIKEMLENTLHYLNKNDRKTN